MHSAHLVNSERPVIVSLADVLPQGYNQLAELMANFAEVGHRGQEKGSVQLLKKACMSARVGIHKCTHMRVHTHTHTHTHT